MDSLDKTDLQILRILQDNSRLTTKELAARVSLSSTPVFERLKRLESNGYIKKYIAVLDAEKLNQGFVVFCSVRLTRLNKDIASEFTRIIQDIPEVRRGMADGGRQVLGTVEQRGQVFDPAAQSAEVADHLTGGILQSIHHICQ